MEWESSLLVSDWSVSMICDEGREDLSEYKKSLSEARGGRKENPPEYGRPLLGVEPLKNNYIILVTAAIKSDFSF